MALIGKMQRTKEGAPMALIGKMQRTKEGAPMALIGKMQRRKEGAPMAHFGDDKGGDAILVLQHHSATTVHPCRQHDGGVGHAVRRAK